MLERQRQQRTGDDEAEAARSDRSGHARKPSADARWAASRHRPERRARRGGCRQKARQGAYQLVELPRRVFDRPLPTVGTIDLRNEEIGRLALKRLLERIENPAADFTVTLVAPRLVQGEEACEGV